jgi:hypothetical protein
MNGGGGRVTLSPNEVDLAENVFKWTKADVAAGRCKPNQVGAPLGKAEFGRRKLAMQRDGRYNSGE